MAADMSVPGDRYLMHVLERAIAVANRRRRYRLAVAAIGLAALATLLVRASIRPHALAVGAAQRPTRLSKSTGGGTAPTQLRKGCAGVPNVCLDLLP